MPQTLAIRGIQIASRERSAGNSSLLAGILLALSEIHEGNERPRCFCVGCNIGRLKAHPQKQCDDIGESLDRILWSQCQRRYLPARVRQPIESRNCDCDARKKSRAAAKRVEILGDVLETLAHLLLKGTAFGDALDESMRELRAPRAEING